MKRINWTRRNKLFAGLGGVAAAALAVVLVFTFVGMPVGGKLFGKSVRSAIKSFALQGEADTAKMQPEAWPPVFRYEIDERFMSGASVHLMQRIGEAGAWLPVAIQEPKGEISPPAFFVWIKGTYYYKLKFVSDTRPEEWYPAYGDGIRIISNWYKPDKSKWFLRDGNVVNTSGAEIRNISHGVFGDVDNGPVWMGSVVGGGLSRQYYDLHSAFLARYDLEGMDLSYANLEGADLRGAYLRNASLTDANLRNANFSTAILEGADLWGNGTVGETTVMTYVYAAGASMGALRQGINFTGSNLEGANLKYIGTAFKAGTWDTPDWDPRWSGRFNFTGANLTGANLYRADLRNSNFTGANLTGADLTEANLTGATGITPSMMPGAKLKNTIWVDGSTRN